MASIINLIKKSKSLHYYEHERHLILTSNNIEYELEGSYGNTLDGFIKKHLHLGKKIKTFSINSLYECDHDNEDIIFPESITHLTLPNMMNLNMNKLKNVKYLEFDYATGINHKIINTLPKSLKELCINNFFGYEGFYDDILKKCKKNGITCDIIDTMFEDCDEEWYYENKEYYNNYERGIVEEECISNKENEKEVKEVKNKKYSYKRVIRDMKRITYFEEDSDDKDLERDSDEDSDQDFSDME